MFGGDQDTVNGSVFNLPGELDFKIWSSYTGLTESVFADISNEIYRSYLHSTFSTDHAVFQDLIKACHDSNIEFDSSPHAGKKNTVSWSHFLHRTDYSRFSTADFLSPFFNDPRMSIVSSCYVQKIHVEDKCATSVECTIRGATKNFRCNKAIICSAGTFGSPLLLERSGIGPKGAVADLPGVGRNLRDHFFVKLRYTPFPGNETPENTPRGLADAIAMYLTGESFLPQGHLQIFLKSYAFLDYPDILAEIFIEESNGDISIYPTIMSPIGSGTVATGNHRYNAFMHAYDILRMRKAIRAIDRMMTHFRDNTFISITNTSQMKDKELDIYICTYYCSWTHPVGTCAMGHSASSVVDSQLHVHNIDRLFIADCSVLPQGVYGGTFAAALCIGEYAAQSILQKPMPSVRRPTLLQIPGCQNLCSRIAIGLSHLGQTPADFAFLDQAVAKGCTTFDCAVVYSGTQSFGAWLKSQPAALRPKLFIIGKGAHPIGNQSRMTRECIFEDIQILLERLGTTYLDCFMLHRDDKSIPVDYIVEWLNEVVNLKLARSYGFSNWTPERIQKAYTHAFLAGLAPIGLVSNYCGPLRWSQPPWPGCVQMNAYQTRFIADDLGIPVLSWSPLSPVLTPAKQGLDPQDYKQRESTLVNGTLKMIFGLSPNVGLVVRTTSIDHLSQIIATEG